MPSWRRRETGISTQHSAVSIQRLTTLLARTACDDLESARGAQPPKAAKEISPGRKPGVEAVERTSPGGATDFISKRNNGQYEKAEQGRPQENQTCFAQEAQDREAAEGTRIR